MKNELKKYLYKENPLAELCLIRMGNAYYVSDGPNTTAITFTVPVSDMGEADFHVKMFAKHLIRWMDEPTEDLDYTHTDFPQK
jgi:hypothetical protein